MTILRTARDTALALLLVAAPVAAQVADIDPGTAPRFEVFVVVSAPTASFNSSIADYFVLRSRLQQGLPLRSVSTDPASIERSELALAARIRRARRNAEEGDIFNQMISVEFRKDLRLVMTSATWAAIMDDNPGAFSHRINGNYPKQRARSTMPATILRQLPTLPEGLEYRFLGPHLILMDTWANVILDRMRYAIYCLDCDD
jgi:hypothetical protein